MAWCHPCCATGMEYSKQGPLLTSNAGRPAYVVSPATSNPFRSKNGRMAPAMVSKDGLRTPPATSILIPSVAVRAHARSILNRFASGMRHPKVTRTHHHGKRYPRYDSASHGAMNQFVTFGKEPDKRNPCCINSDYEQAC